MNLINIETGESLNEDSSDEQISEALKAVKMKINELQKISDDLNEVAMDRVRPGDKTFANYWSVIEGKRNVLEFPSREEEKKVKETIQNIQAPYQVQKVFRYLKFPKF